MKRGYVDDFDLERLITAIEHDFYIEPLEKPEVAVRDKDTEGDENHIVNVERLDCTCEDYQYQCQKLETELADYKYCKHIYRVIFEKENML